MYISQYLTYLPYIVVVVRSIKVRSGIRTYLPTYLPTLVGY
jgi:hypothetical protein